jgi:GDP-D-mannose dehydratase
MLMRVIALVVGSSGQDGRILELELSRLGYKVLAASSSATQYESLPITYCDLSKVDMAHQLLTTYQPDLIFHVAAIHGSSETQDSIIATKRAEMYACHVGITQNILTWLTSNPLTKLHVALSSQMYQATHSATPINELSITNPQNFYGQTKSEAWDLLREYRSSHDLKVSASILFNHSSKYSKDEFVFAKLANQFVEVLRRERTSLSLRNPSAMIDISSAFEICSAMILNVIRFPQEDFVLASGKPVRLSDVILSVAAKLGVSNQISNIDHFCHPKISDFSSIVLADPKKARELLHWQAEIAPAEILLEIISHKLMAGRN